MCLSGTADLSAGAVAFHPRVTRIVLTGIAAGLAAMALFIAIHSLLIFPIWDRALRGLPFAAIGGIGLAAAFEEMGRWRTVGGGARFGAVMFATLVPATAYSNALRLAGVPANDWPGLVGSLAIALASGAAAGWWLTRRRQGVGTFAAATLAVTVAMAGPVPVVNGPPAAWLFAGFLPICVGAGIALAAARQALAGLES